MAKPVTKKTDKSKPNKGSDEKLIASKKTKNGNKKEISATNEKSVNKKSATIKKNPIKITEAKLPVTENKEPNYNESKFKIVADELWFLKQVDDSFRVKLMKDATVSKRDDLNFELRGVLADGTDVGTILDCSDYEEANQFMNEIINYVKTGEMIIDSGENNSTTEITNSNSDNNPSESINNKPLLEEFKDIPLMADDMDVLINELKQNEQPNNIVPNNVNTHNFNNTNTNDSPLFTQNMMNQNITFKMSNEQILSEMRKYGNSIEHNINETFQVRIQGGLPKQEFLKVIDGCSKEYSYDLKNDGKGYFLNINQGELQLRVPEDINQYLKIN